MGMKRLVYGVGVNDIDNSVFTKGVSPRYYSIWAAMLQRCYSLKLHSRRSTYIGCSVCDEWKYLSNFKKWFDENYVEGFALDKDILVEGNKIYSPETCRFVPVYLNTLLTIRHKIKYELPTGIYEDSTIINGIIYNRYVANCRDGNGHKLSKKFKTISEAKVWYSETKKRIVKEQAQRAFLDNAIKTDVYLALVRRNF